MSNLNFSINETPAMPNHSWRFAHLSAADLLPLLQQHLLACNSQLNWQIVWLNNDGKPIIGLLPKVSWQLYPQANDSLAYKVITTYRDKAQTKTVATTTYEAWQQQLIRYSQNYEGCQNLESTTQPPLAHYHHGLIGFISYDVAAMQLSPATNIQAAMQPLAVLGHYDIYLSAEKKGLWSLTLKSNRRSSSDSDRSDTCFDDNVLQLIAYLEDLEAQLAKKQEAQVTDEALSLYTPKQPTPLILQPQWSKNDYQQAFAQTQRYLQQGDCYQINLTQAWQGELTAAADNKNPLAALSLIDYLPSLQRNTQAPFAAYMSVHSADDGALNSLDFELLSCSPELFFTFNKDADHQKHYITTKPIKGTMPRGTTSEADADFKQQLISSDKDRSENVMIVDLLRNDLGKYAKIGSVKVPQLFAIESFSNVHHMVSTITAELKADSHPLAVLFGSLPAGSITGTPKRRAVEIISELEVAPRGAYCGTMGYMNFEGSGQWNVLIRSLQATNLDKDNKQVSLWAGGGITVASDVDAEYQECLDKVGNLLAVLAQAED